MLLAYHNVDREQKTSGCGPCLGPGWNEQWPLEQCHHEDSRGGDPGAEAEDLRGAAMGNKGDELQIEQGTCKGPVVDKFCGFERQEWEGRRWAQQRQAEVVPIL